MLQNRKIEMAHVASAQLKPSMGLNKSARFLLHWKKYRELVLRLEQ